jgi:hypothetical protein
MSLPDLPPANGHRRDRQSSDWRFAVILLTTVLLATMAIGTVVYIEDGMVPGGLANLGAALLGALILLIGKHIGRDD